ncbi:hypothetical protein JKF63_06769 [Porcisia hertigi]|uniref:Uncharacterized protein n=1 Tax=Porcisia hertigi TaxID=2761500 RepID=A0A836ICB4_9TRYP|nr:hypothetical protein JKF63_06769 [Porcisia hertigi]
MSVDTQDVAVEVDLSKLIDFGVTFQPLQLTLKDILRRLADLERENVTQNDQITEMMANIARLEEVNEALQKAQSELAAAAVAKTSVIDGEDGEEAEGKDTGSEHAALWDEMSLLNDVLGELHEGATRGRPSIDEIYAARKHRDSIVRKASVPLGSASQSIGSKSGASQLLHSPARTASGSAVVPPARDVSPGSAGTSQRQQDPLLEVSSEALLPLGDIVLSKAHEALEMVPESQKFSEGSPHAGGDEDAASVRDSKARTQTSASSASGSLGVCGTLRRGVTVVDGPYGPKGRLVVGTSKSQAAVGLQEGPSSSLHQEVLASPPAWPAATGGEDAGEHREAVETVSSDQQQPQQLPRRSSKYAEKRLAEGAARRLSARGAPSPSGAYEKSPLGKQLSVCNILRRDGEDIAYLNRVVAEILGEMKGLHDAVDLLRMGHEDGNGVPAWTNAPVDAANINNLSRRLARLEGDVADVSQRTRHSDKQREEELDDLKKQLRVARGLTDDDVNALRSSADLADRLRQLEGRAAALEAAQGILQEQFSSVLAVGEDASGEGLPDINALQFAALQGAVKALEKQLEGLLVEQEDPHDWTNDIRKINDALQAVEADLESAQDHLVRLGKEASRLDMEKANRTELPDPVLIAKADGDAGGDMAATAALSSRISRAEADIERLKEAKADRTALHKLRDDLDSLQRLVERSSEQGLHGADLDSEAVSQGMEGMLRELQGELSALKEADNARFGGGLGGNDGKELLDRLERLENCKADATLVANKAERDYVENALERLMREVEQVLNATNAGLIDTLEKSLGILRDMIDGKATKQDVAKLQGWMAESNLGGGGGAGAPDGLTGFKGFRCLGCNRPMDSMRPRALAAPMSPFLNRNPQNHIQDNVTRTIQQQQAPPRAGGGAGGHAAALGATASSSHTIGSAEGLYQRGTNSEPLPPIEPM